MNGFIMAFVILLGLLVIAYCIFPFILFVGINVVYMYTGFILYKIKKFFKGYHNE